MRINTVEWRSELRKHLNRGLTKVYYSDVQFLLFTGQENSGQIVCYSGTIQKQIIWLSEYF